MHLLYIGQLWEGSTTLERMRTLERLGIEPIAFDTTPYSRLGIGLEQSLAWRTSWGRGVTRLNRALEAFCGREPFDVVWIDKGVWIWAETVAALRSASRHRFAVHYTPDPQLVFHCSRHFFASIPMYDLVVTTKPYELDLYKAKGARQVILTLQGYNARFAPLSRSGEVRRELGSDVCFVGHCERHYAHQVKVARMVNADVKVWGPGWVRYARLNLWARDVVQNDGIWGDRYLLALDSAKIGLGLLSKWIPETTTTRTFEIPATGVFMLAERNPDHLALFEEGKEAEFFASDEELKDKIRFYLANDGARARIAAAGRERCVKSGYSDEHQLRRVLARMAELIGSGSR